MDQARARGGGGGGQAPTAAAEDYTPTSWDVFVAIRDHIERNPDIIGKISYVFQFQIKDPDSLWTVDLKNDKGGVSEGETTTPDCTLAIAEADFMAMTDGSADPMTLFTSGKLKISGNIMASQKLEFLQKIPRDEAEAAVRAALERGEGPGKGQAAAAPSGSSSDEPHAEEVFVALSKRLATGKGDHQHGTVLIKVAEPDDTWFVDLSGCSVAHEDKDATATITLTDSDLVALANGQSTLRDLFQRGKIRLDGDVEVARRLTLLEGLL
jgi:3-hydroxyacyl-CoA dehydrogenase/3a,7a,12a-trihydroxy-5b-cholest-24-enoyl-CoA hydratase